MDVPVPPVDDDAASFPPIESSFSAVNGPPNNTSSSNTTSTTTTSTSTATPMIPTRQAPSADISSFEPVKLENSPAPSRLNSTDAETPGAEADDDTNGSKSRTATAGRKRKLNNLSARGVANLTPDQLAKKRANDRQAQRAIRERTKTHIDALEQQVSDLSSQKPMLDLQAAMRRNEAVLEENRELRQGLKAAMDIIRPLLEKPESTSNGPGPAPINIERPHRPSNASPPCLENNDFTPNSQRSAMADQSYVDSTASNGTPSPTHSAPPLGGTRRSSAGDTASFRVAFDFQRHNLAHGLDFGAEERLGFNFLVDPSKSFPTADGSHRNSEGLRTPSQFNPPIYPPQFTPSVTELSSPAYLTPIRNTAPTCTLDAILLDFLHTRQQEAAQGVPKQNLVGPPYPSVSSLLNPEKSVDSHPLSKVFTDILRAFPNIAALPEQVCILYLMFLLMRWQIYPTAENYERLPDWLTPRPSQLLTRHPAWIDYLPWPRMRDRLVMSHQKYQFENWFVPFTETISINWPYEATDCLLSTNDSDDLLINPVFERHFRNLNNWSLGPTFAEAYPEMAETTSIRKTNGLPWHAP